MKKYVFLLLILPAFAPLAAGQGIMQDVMAGALVNPEVGVYAWYTLTDAETEREFFLRQAIVAEEKVKRKTGWWVETEIIPRVGHPAVYKMLLTGPASDPDNIHQIIVQEGGGLPHKVEVDKSAKPDKAEDAKRVSQGLVELTTEEGAVQAEHFLIETPTGKSQVWLNADIRPMGIVRMETAQGVLMLTRHGKGGPEAISTLGPVTDEKAGVGNAPSRNFNVRVEKGKRTLPDIPEQKE